MQTVKICQIKHKILILEMMINYKIYTMAVDSMGRLMQMYCMICRAF